MASFTPGTLNFDSIASSLAGSINQLESNINLQQQSGNMTAGDLLKLQQTVTQWSILNETATTVVKTLGDTLKSALQKVG